MFSFYSSTILNHFASMRCSPHTSMPFQTNIHSPYRRSREAQRGCVLLMIERSWVRIPPIPCDFAGFKHLKALVSLFLWHKSLLWKLLLTIYHIFFQLHSFRTTIFNIFNFFHFKNFESTSWHAQDTLPTREPLLMFVCCSFLLHV